MVLGMGTQTNLDPRESRKGNESHGLSWYSRSPRLLYCLPEHVGKKVAVYSVTRSWRAGRWAHQCVPLQGLHSHPGSGNCRADPLARPITISGLSHRIPVLPPSLQQQLPERPSGVLLYTFGDHCICIFNRGYLEPQSTLYSRRAGTPSLAGLERVVNSTVKFSQRWAP